MTKSDVSRPGAFVAHRPGDRAVDALLAGYPDAFRSIVERDGAMILAICRRTRPTTISPTQMRFSRLRVRRGVTKMSRSDESLDTRWVHGVAG